MGNSMGGKLSIEHVYLLLGPESGEKSQRICAIRDAISRQSGLEPEMYRYYPFDTEVNDLFSILENNSLFSDHRLVIINQIEDSPLQLCTALIEYLKHPSDSATLLLLSNEISVNAKLTQAVPKKNIEIFWEMFENRKIPWVRDFFRRNNADITDDATELLLELVENNTQELRNVCSQLIQFFSSERPQTKLVIQEEDIETYVHHSRKENAFTLFETIANGDLEQALAILHVLVTSGEGDSVPLLAMLLWQFRRLASYADLLKQGYNHEQACQKTSVAGKPSPIKRKKDQLLTATACRIYSPDQIGNIIARIGEYDIKTREASTDMQLLWLERFLYVVIVKKGTNFQTAVWPSLSTGAMF